MAPAPPHRPASGQSRRGGGWWLRPRGRTWCRAPAGQVFLLPSEQVQCGAEGPGLPPARTGQGSELLSSGGLGAETWGRLRMDLGQWLEAREEGRAGLVKGQVSATEISFPNSLRRQ